MNEHNARKKFTRKTSYNCMFTLYVFKYRIDFVVRRHLLGTHSVLLHVTGQCYPQSALLCTI